MSREDRKAGRRARQLEAEQKKAAGEDAYFRQCAGEAQRLMSGGKGLPSMSEAELFGKQGTMGINFDNYDAIEVKVSGPGADQVDALENFSDLGRRGVPPFLGRNVRLMRYEKPTPIQKHALPRALNGSDLMCCAQTGSGKTCAFLYPICSSLGLNQGVTPRSGSAFPEAVIMAPTRELASQIHLEALKLTHKSPLRAVVVYGGADQRRQLRELAFGCSICVATPGRLTDFAERGLVSLSCVRFLVLDEADRMLDMGFEPQIRRIVQKQDMPPKENRQTMMFSATFPSQIQQLAQEFLRPYVWIAVGRVGATAENITQRIVQATNDKRLKLRLVAEAIAEREGRTLVFVQKKRTATWVKHKLRNGGVQDGGREDRFRPVMAEDIHGDRSQSQRESALAAFRAGKCKVLVATDVAARGLDITGVEHVINMDLPCSAEEFDSYVHRIGRTGRAGHTGLATSLYVPGFDPKTGNGKIAPLLLSQLRACKQTVPGWFSGLPECRSGRGAGGSNSASKPKFGGSDQRRAPTATPKSQVSIQNFTQDSSGGRGRGRGRGGRGRGRGGRGRGRGGRGGRQTRS